MRTSVFAVLALASVAQGGDVLGYLENWVDVRWWDQNMPGKCLMGCFNPQPYLEAITPYSSVNYGFTFLTENPEPAQVMCTNAPNDTMKGNASGPCPVWDGKAIYMAHADKPGAEAVTASTTAPTPGTITIMEACRMARMHPDGPKRFKISLGGWSDFARLGNNDNAVAVAKLAAKLVQMTFADGVDLDFEHLTMYQTITGDDEFAAFATLVKTLKTELETTVKPQWAAKATAMAASLQEEFDALPMWQQEKARPYYMTNIAYCKEIAKNDPPQFEVSWTTRFNAFLPKNDPWNYLLPGSWKPNVTFATDNEGEKIYAESAQYIDTVNVMVYDAGPMKINFTQVMENFINIGKVPKKKILIGYEPGEQAAGGIWEGLAADKANTQEAKDLGLAGAFIWAVNPSNITNPKGVTLCPETAKAVNAIMEPTWHWGPEPTYTKCNPTTGWGPDAEN